MSEQIAYKIRYGNGQPPLEIRHSANAWWMDKSKVERLIIAFKYDFTIDEACHSILITERQYKYFVDMHPEIREIREYCKVLLTIRAKKALIDRIDTDKSLALKYLERKEPEEFGKKKRQVVVVPYCQNCKKEIQKSEVPKEFVLPAQTTPISVKEVRERIKNKKERYSVDTKPRENLTVLEKLEKIKQRNSQHLLTKNETKK